MRGVRVRTTRLVSFVQRAAAAILFEVEPLDGPVRVVAQSELVANEPMPPSSTDPRAAAVLDSPLSSEEHSHLDARVVLVHSTQRSKLRLAAAMDHLVEGPDGDRDLVGERADVGRVTIAADLAPGECLRIVKFLAYGSSSQRSLPAVRDLAVAALAEARHTGWEGLLAGQRAYLDGLLGSSRRGDRRRRRAPAGCALRALPHASGGCASRAPCDRRQGPDRHRAMTATRSGTPSGSSYRC